MTGIGTASFLADVGHEIPTALLPNLLTATLGAPAAALGLIEGLSDGLAGAARLAGGAIADDPRLALWQYTFERIRERPWLGYGFGKSILRTEFQDELRDPMLGHAHNLFVSQWLQTGVVGMFALCAVLVALGWRYAAFLRADDGTLAALGLTGLAMLAMFVTKNLTDDFMMRPTSKEFWAMSALLVGYGIRRERSASLPP